MYNDEVPGDYLIRTAITETRKILENELRQKKACEESPLGDFPLGDPSLVIGQ
jgi:hypothetical protein